MALSTTLPLTSLMFHDPEEQAIAWRRIETIDGKAVCTYVCGDGSDGFDLDVCPRLAASA